MVLLLFRVYAPQPSDVPILAPTRLSYSTRPPPQVLPAIVGISRIVVDTPIVLPFLRFQPQERMVAETVQVPLIASVDGVLHRLSLRKVRLFCLEG